MSIFDTEILPRIHDISKTCIKNLNDGVKEIFENFDKFEEKLLKGSSGAREKIQKDKLAVTLQSINEDEDPEPPKAASKPDRTSAKSDTSTSSNNSERRASKKRSKNEVDGILSPEQDKRQKRNASVKAQSIISKQVNVNLTQKLRRENSADKLNKNPKEVRSQRQKDEDKENSEPNKTIPVAQIKQEKLSIPEPMDTESLPVDIPIKHEIDSKERNDDIAMPPPIAPVPKPRKGIQKEKSEESIEDDSSSKRRTTRTRKQNDMPPPPVPSARSTRSSNRVRRTDTVEDPPLPPPEPRPKRTRAKKKASLTPSKDAEKDSMQESVSAVSSPADKPRPKRTRRNKKAAEQPEPPKETEKIPKESPEPPKDTEKIRKEQPELPKETEKQIIPKQERISFHSPILQKDVKPKKGKINPIPIEIEASLQETTNEVNKINKTNIKSQDKVDLAMDETRVISKIGDMDKTMVLPNGVYNHAPETPKNQIMNETVVVETINNQTIVIDKPNNVIMDSTVVLDKGPKGVNVTEDNSLLTDDSDYHDAQTPPLSKIPVPQPSSAVKEKVQQFEELASRVTRTKTRALAKKEEQQTDTHTPPDKIIKPVLSQESLNKMNNLIFNGKHPGVSNSATKPRAVPVKTVAPSSTSKPTSTRTTDVEDRNRVEDPRQKKEAMLEAKRELQRRKREEKMAAAAAAREAAERERLAAVNAAALEKQEKLAHAQAGKMARLKEVERKKQEYARKVAETEERRRAEEAARLQRLAEEQKRAEQQRKKQLEEQLQMKKEEARMAKEIEKRQKEYIEKQKLKQRKEDKCRTPGTPGGYPPVPPCEPVYMQDGFQYLNSDDDEDAPQRPPPPWSTTKARKLHLEIQCRITSALIDRLFSVRVHSPDLVELFPTIERNRLKRTSSAVWRTPPRLEPVLE